MKITLRKAKALQTSIIEVINSLALNPTIALSEFDNADAVIITAKESYNKSLNLRSDLYRVLFDIRSSVGKANVDSGISDFLAKRAFYEKIINDVSTATDSVVKDLTVLAQKQEKMKKASVSNSYTYREDSITTGIFDQSFVDDIKVKIANLKREKQSIADSLLELNITTEIELSEKDVDLLKRVNIL